MRIDLTSDLHTHSSLTDGADTAADMAVAARRAGLEVWGLSDHVRADTTWLPEYVPMVRALRVEGLRIRCGVEVKLLDATGRLDLPPTHPVLDYVLIADHQFPSARGPVHPSTVRAELEAGTTTAADVVATIVDATCDGLYRAPAAAIVAHLFSLLPKLGLSERDVTDEHRAALAASCLRTGAAVEVNEKWACPAAVTIEYLAAAGVRVVAGSDAHRCADVGRWTYAQSLVTSAELARPAASAAV